MGYWNSRGLRGSGLEELINITNEKYREKKLALVQKIPTPITPIEFDKESRRISVAYFEKKSTVDYIGVVQGYSVCFDAKECDDANNTFALKNIHEHQFQFMKEFEEQNGIAFLVILYTRTSQFYYMRFSELKRFWERAEKGGRKSFRFDELDEGFLFESPDGAIVPYLKLLQRDIEGRD